MSIKHHIISGSAANFISIAASATVQIASVPVLSICWGVEQYGLWLMLTTVPTYISLSDFGFASAATSQMGSQTAAGRHKAATATFQSIWLLLNVIALAVVLICGIALLYAPSLVGHTGLISDERGTLFLLILYAGAAMNTRLLLGALRATRNYASGTLLHEGLALLETLSVLTLAWCGYDFQNCALAMFLLRLVNIGLLWMRLHQCVPWLRLGVRYASKQELIRLWRPAIAAMAIPTALAANLQGTLLVAGFFISTSAAATLASARTVSRVAIQIVGAINRATMPELSAAGGRNDEHAIQKIVALNAVMIGFVLVPGGMLFAAFGAQFVAAWTHGHITPDSSFIAINAVVMVLHGAWYYLANLMLAANRHTRVAGFIAVASGLSVVFSIPAAHFYGLDGLASTLAVSELVCLVYVTRAALDQGLLRSDDLLQAPQLWLRRL